MDNGYRWWFNAKATSERVPSSQAVLHFWDLTDYGPVPMRMFFESLEDANKHKEYLDRDWGAHPFVMQLHSAENQMKVEAHHE